MDADSGLSAMALLKAIARALIEMDVFTADEWPAIVDDTIFKSAELPNADEIIAGLMGARDWGLQRT